MTHFWDQLTRQVSEAATGIKTSDDDTMFLLLVNRIEQRAVRAVVAVSQLPNFPSDLRDKIARAIERSRTPDALKWRVTMHCSELLDDLHSLFHEVATRRIETEFGVLSDDPEGSLKRIDLNAKEAFEEHIDTCVRCNAGAAGYCDRGNALEKQWSFINDRMAEGVPPENYPQ